MTTIVDIDDQKRAWCTYNVRCLSCKHEWHAVLHRTRLTELECPVCKNMAGEANTAEFIARWLYWRTASFGNANLLDCNFSVQEMWRDRAADMIEAMRLAGWEIKWRELSSLDDKQKSL